MSWYYTEGTERRGPVTEAEWSTLVSSGVITPQTLVWRTGLQEWLPYAAVAEQTATRTPAAATSFATTATTLAGTRCSECGNTFPADEVVNIEGQAVCAGCKPVVMQKLKEGIHISGAMVYAGFMVRLGAKIIDGILQQIASYGAGMIIGLAVGGSGENNAGIAAALGALVGLAIGAAYSTFFLGKYGATPGKMACKLRVVRANGEAISYGRAFGRYFAEIVSSLTLLIGYIMAAFDDEKRALHDRICDTRVIRL